MSDTVPPNPTLHRLNRLRVPLILGLVFLPLGLWLFLESQGAPVPAMRSWWPCILLLIAAGLAIDFFVLTRRPRSAGLAVFYLGLGLLLFGFTLGQNSWGHMLDRLPALPLIIGVALIVTWFADSMRDSSLLVVGLIFAVLGLLGLAARFDVLRNLLPRAQELWAIGFLVVGAVLLWRVIRQARSD